MPLVRTDGLSGGRSVYGHVITKFSPAPISSRFLCPRPPLLFSAPNQNRHATQATKTLISHPHNTASYAGYRYSYIMMFKVRHKLTLKKMKPDINLVKTTLKYRLRFHSVRYGKHSLRCQSSYLWSKLPHVDKNSRVITGIFLSAI